MGRRDLGPDHHDERTGIGGCYGPSRMNKRFRKKKFVGEFKDVLAPPLRGYDAPTLCASRVQRIVGT